MIDTINAVALAFAVGHGVGDHVLQTDHQARHKADAGRIGINAMAGHIFGQLAAQTIALVALWPYGLAITGAGAVVGLLISIGSHAVIDRRTPVRWLLVHTGSPHWAARIDGAWPTGMYQADQALHLAFCYIAALAAVAVSAIT